MSVDTTPTVDRDDVTTSSAAKPGPVPRVIAGSLAAGAAAALVLSLVVFPGATEASSPARCWSGSGSAGRMLAALSVRCTNQPQRWAVVPAAAMTATGLALVALDPGGRRA